MSSQLAVGCKRMCCELTVREKGKLGKFTWIFRVCFIGFYIAGVCCSKLVSFLLCVLYMCVHLYVRCHRIEHNSNIIFFKLLKEHMILFH